MSKHPHQRPRKAPPVASLRALRLVSGKTLDQVCEAVTDYLRENSGKADRAPFTRGAMSAIETGTRGASPEVLSAIEFAYGLDAGALAIQELREPA